MKEITIHVDDETYRLAYARAKNAGMSLPDLLHDYFYSYVREAADGTASDGLDAEARLELRRKLLREALADFEARGIGIDMSENLPRDELYDRNALR